MATIHIFGLTYIYVQRTLIYTFRYLYIFICYSIYAQCIVYIITILYMRVFRYIFFRCCCQFGFLNRSILYIYFFVSRQSFFFILFQFFFYVQFFFFIYFFLLHIVESIGYIFTHVSNIHTNTRKEHKTQPKMNQITTRQKKKTLLFLLFFFALSFLLLLLMMMVCWLYGVCVCVLLHDGFIMDFV